MSDLSKSFTLEEVEALLAAERERALALCDAIAASAKREAEVVDYYGFRIGFQARQKTAEAIAAAIRSLAPQTIGDE